MFVHAFLYHYQIPSGVVEALGSWIGGLKATCPLNTSGYQRTSGYYRISGIIIIKDFFSMFLSWLIVSVVACCIKNVCTSKPGEIIAK